MWDVGHQAYGHKLLTGRRDKFDTNRKFGGLSGFPIPKRALRHLQAGHASNSISAALGMAMASELNNDKPRRNVVAVIGDASISGGLAFEGLNNASITRTISSSYSTTTTCRLDRNVGALNSYLAHLNTTRAYNRFRYRLFRLLKKLHLVTDKQKGFIMRFNNSVKSLLSHQQNIFEGLNIRYFGPIDGHDIDRVVRVLSDIKDMEGPRLLHLRDQRQRATTRPRTTGLMACAGLFDPKSGERKHDSDSRPSIRMCSDTPCSNSHAPTTKSWASPPQCRRAHR